MSANLTNPSMAGVTRPLKSSPTRVRADRERAQAAALAELETARDVRLKKSERLRELRLAKENAAPVTVLKKAPRSTRRVK